MPLTLTKPLIDVQKAIVNQIKIGQAIRSQRIEYVEDLEEARAEKQEWVSRTTQMLNQLFGDTSVADECNDWVGPILPEFAEWGLFVEQFDKEMKHRIGRLRELLSRLEATSDPESSFSRRACSPLETPPITEPKEVETTAAKAARYTKESTIVLHLPDDQRCQEAIRDFLHSLLNSLESDSPTIVRSDRIG